ncbi:CRISPR-associated protein Cas4 [Desulfocarbo indianensis]|nr:CRISPR-associated protein Cas4 [Desulfocarbo indianensis]
MHDEADLIPISALQHWVFCPRQCGLIHLEGSWEENPLTAQGRLLHEKAHEAGVEQRGPVRVERGLALRSLALGLTGKADVVEFHPEGAGWRPYPVEYKRGRPKDHDADRLQLCAQAMCLEEMLNTPVPAGALFYGANRRREEVVFSGGLREAVERAAREVRDMLASGRLPRPSPGPYCRSCSLVELCLPRQTGAGDSASGYLRRQMKSAREES